MSIAPFSVRLINLKLIVLSMVFAVSVSAEEYDIFSAPRRKINLMQLRALKLNEKTFHFVDSKLDVFVVVTETGSGVVWQRVDLYSKSNSKDELWYLKSVVWEANSFVSVKMIASDQEGNVILIEDANKKMLAKFGESFIGLQVKN